DADPAPATTPPTNNHAAPVDPTAPPTTSTTPAPSATATPATAPAHSREGRQSDQAHEWPPKPQAARLQTRSFALRLSGALFSATKVGGGGCRRKWSFSLRLLDLSLAACHDQSTSQQLT